MMAWLTDINNQFILTLMALCGTICFLWGHRIGERDGYEDGVRTLAKTMKLNNVRLKLDFEDEDKC